MDLRSVCSVSTGTSSTITIGATEKVRAITSQAWPDLGSRHPLRMCGSPSKTEEIVERLCYILLVRIAAVVTSRDGYEGARVLRADDVDLSVIDDVVPVDVQRQLLEYLEAVLATYRKVYYHSIEHAYHVVVSANKLLDMLLQPELDERRVKRTFGIRGDPLSQLALIFAAVVHDADHQGVSNAQLVEEDDELAILYNDQSVAEQHSLAIGFQILSRPQFKDLKATLFEAPAQYRTFRKTVIDLVLCTDIASPDRAQITASKWKETFGGKQKEDETESKVLERNVRNIMQKKGQARRRSNDDADTRNINRTNNNITNINSNSEADMSHPPPPSRRGWRSNCGYSASEITAQDKFVQPSDDDDVDDDTSPPVRLIGTKSNSNKSMRSGRSGSLRLSALSELSEDANVVTELEGLLDDDDDDDDDDHRPDEEDEKDEKDEPVDPEIAAGRRFHRLSIVRRCSTDALHNATTYMDRYTMRSQSLHVDVSSNDGSSAFDSVVRTMPRRSSAPERGDLERRHRPRELRLGVRLAIDLTGKTVVPFGRRRRGADRRTGDAVDDDDRRPLRRRDDDDAFDDEPDPFRASVALQTMMHAADVSAPMQDWNRLQIWCSRLFFEQKRSFDDGRNAVDPAESWYEGQTKFMDFYVLPLARRLDELGVFGAQGQQFASFAEENRRIWIEQGEKFTAWMIRKWDSLKNSHDEL